MANENNEISDIVKKCKILLLDIEGTTTSISFVKDKLFPYAEEHVKEFLDTKWDEEDVKEAVSALRKLALEDQEKNVEGVVAIPGEDAPKEEQIEGLVKNVKWQMSSDRKVGALKQLQGLIWKQGYDKGDIKGHVYDDVLPAIEQWRSVDGQKIYIYSSGSVQAQKLLFGMSSAGDMLPHIDGHFDTAVGAKQEEASYKAIAEKINCKPEEILFLTDIVKEAAAARAAGVSAALVSREGNAPLPSDATAAYPVLHTFAQLTATNKRKPHSQDEQPAKVPKTETEGDVKSATEEAIVKASETSEPINVQEPEKMEVEEKPADVEENKQEAITACDAPAQVESVIENVTNVTTIGDIPVVESNRIVEEVSDKPEEKEIEKMETNPIENEKTVEEVTENKEKVKDNSENATSVEEDISLAARVVDVTDDKDAVNGGSDICIATEPVVRQPEDIEDLQKAGEVLEKECDEILSKVGDIAYLENIPLKPSLNTIAEETMDTDNNDTNDIVDNILDTEMELSMKPCEEDLSLKPVDEVADKKTDVDGKSKTTESNAEAAKDDKPTEAVTQEKKEEAKEPETVCPTETVVDKVNEKDEQKSESKVESQPCSEEQKSVSEKSTATTEETVMETEVSAAVSKANTDESKTNEKCEAPESAETKKAEPELSETVNNEQPAVSSTEKDEQEVKVISTEEVKTDSEVKDAQVNGNSNGDSESVNVNGDASKDEELSSRLSVENGNKAVNGSNGDSVEEQGQGDNKVEIGVSDIKVKTVATDEPRSDPIEQPTEA